MENEKHNNMLSEESFSRKGLENVAALGLAIGLIAATFILPGGGDAHVVYRPYAEGCETCGYAPYHITWLLFPLRFVPDLILWQVITLLSILGIVWAAKRLDTPPIYVLATFPMLAYVWLGQVDALIVVGLTLALTSKNPYIRGLGLTIASIKPQVAAPAILLLLIRDEAPIKTLLIPVAAFVLSLFTWGADWVIRWLTYILNNPYNHAWALGSLFPMGLLAFPLVFLFKEKREQLTVILLATALGIPRVGIYSHVIYLVLFAPVWAIPLSYIWVIALAWMGNKALQFTFVLPLGLLIALILPKIKAWSAKREESKERASTPDTPSSINS